MSETPTVWVTVETDEEVTETAIRGERASEDVGGGFGPRKIAEAIARVAKRKRVPLDAQLLKDQMTGLLAVVGDLFEQASQQPQMKLQELELSVEINGEGQVSLVGNSAKLGSTGGITMKFAAK